MSPLLTEHSANRYASFVICLRPNAILGLAGGEGAIRAERLGSLPC